jgi:hypothetical protein
MIFKFLQAFYKKMVQLQSPSPSLQAYSIASSTKKKPAKFTIFTECSQLTLDPFWQQVFEECSRGKFPKGSGIDSDGTTVYFRGKQNANGTMNAKNMVSYKLQTTPEEIFTSLKKLFQEQLNIKSNLDKAELRAELDDICDNLRESYGSSWQQIKRKKIKDPIIRRYILDLKSQYNLNDYETAEVAQIIRLGFLFNWITNENVVYEDQHIIEIQTLTFDEEERIFELAEPDVYYKREYKPKKTRLSTLWSKHLIKPINRYTL